VAQPRVLKDVAETAYRIERGIERGASDRVVDDVEAAIIGVLGDIVIDSRRLIVDGRCAELRDQTCIIGQSPSRIPRRRRRVRAGSTMCPAPPCTVWPACTPAH
jgi:hypothetical protein